MKTLSLTAALLAAGVVSAVPQVKEESVVLTPSADGSRVTIAYEIENEPAVVTMDVLKDGVSIGAENFLGIFGDVNRAVGTGAHEITWCPKAGYPATPAALTDGAVQVKIVAWATNALPPYMAVSLDAVPASDFVRFYSCEKAVPFGVSNDVYKTSVMLMRKIPAANVVWKMGSPVGEGGREAKRELLHNVTLSQDYYLAIYPVTQGQYMRVCGLPKNCQPTNEDTYRLPVNGVSWNILCCDDDNKTDFAFAYPYDGELGSRTFLERLRLRSAQSVRFNLPTSAQWEFACRAGTATAFNDGSSTNYAALAWYKDNSLVDAPHEVGLKKPNAWGLYDMHGQEREWVLDWYDEPTGEDVVDPKGASTGSYKSFRGGDFQDTSSKIRSAYYDVQLPTYGHRKYGFRACAPAVYVWKE